MHPDWVGLLSLTIVLHLPGHRHAEVSNFAQLHEPELWREHDGMFSEGEGALFLQECPGFVAASAELRSTVDSAGRAFGLLLDHLTDGPGEAHTSNEHLDHRCNVKPVQLSCCHHEE